MLMVANEIFKALPISVHDLLQRPYRGNIIHVSAESDLANANKDDVQANVVFLKPLVRKWSDKAQSVYLIADVMLALDNLFGGNLLTLTTQLPRKTDVALGQAARLKKCLGHLFMLARRSEGSWSEEIFELKGFCNKRPGSATKDAEATPDRTTKDNEQSLDDLVIELISTLDDEESSVCLELLEENDLGVEQFAELLMDYVSTKDDVPETPSPMPNRALSFASGSSGGTPLKTGALFWSSDPKYCSPAFKLTQDQKEAADNEYALLEHELFGSQVSQSESESVGGDKRKLPWFWGSNVNHIIF